MEKITTHIRPLKPTDIDQATKIIEQNYPDEQYGPRAGREMEAMFEDGAIKPEFLVCEDEQGSMLGFGGYIQSWMDYCIYELFWINVAPASQRQGIGSLITQALVEAIRKDDAMVKAIIGSASHPDFYKKLGSVEQIKLDGRDYLMVRRVG